MTLTNNEVSFILSQIVEVKKIKGLPFLDFYFKLIDIKKIIQDKVKCLEEKVELLQKQRTDLILKYCQKDPIDNKPIINDNNYQGLFRGVNPEYDQESDKIKDVLTKIGDQVCELSESEKQQLESIKIDKSIFENTVAKKEFNGDITEMIRYFLKE